MKRPVVSDLIALLLVVLFTYAATSKLLDHGRFTSQLMSSPLVRTQATLVTWTLPATEWVVVVLLCVPATRRAGLLAALGLMLMFTGYVAYVVFLSANIPCSCGGVLQRMGWRTHLVFNAVFFLLAAWAVWINKRQPSH